ncbi:MAG TPA: glutamine synthetase III [Candidatus Limiplasma sp.]|nr:glutamine synthetase III [Candidatus Limiplasma sp.]HRX09198.1 glutamine synthetase III [Candidatus Limiplasma sp.]
MNSCERFGENVFNDAVMQKRLPKETYKALKRTIEGGQSLDPEIAGVVANAMKDWALELGATHYTHWFQPMTGITAEKHDSFIKPKGDGSVILEFSGKELVQGEPDASSFPSGGIRATFEARGYTAWDPTSYAFIKDGSLCIPTAFCSYGGEALDKKTPLLRAMQALNKQALRVLKFFGNDDVKRVYPTAGPEQEYFLIDKEDYKKRPDLITTGRTLFGAAPSKGQELEDHYFGAIRSRVSAFMKEMNEELWKLGVYSKTEHNEVAPAQHEMAPVFTIVNVAADHNQLAMEVMKRVADKHGLICLLHEKPFAGVNGSGKHNNYSLSTDTGMNLLDPGDTPNENAQFLLFLAAVIQAVDDYQDLLRVSIASAGNDHRLGANEAPPAIISMFLGEELAAVIDSIVSESAYNSHKRESMLLGVDVLPAFPKDNTDRNRTSPFAFTGNKFEFRSLGSSQSISSPNINLTTAIAESLSQFADELEKADDFTMALNTLIRRVLKEHKHIIFNGNNYDPSWVVEAEKRGLMNLKSTVDAAPYYIAEKNVALYVKHGIFSATEVHSRYEVKLEKYIKVINIEALCMSNMAHTLILPAALEFGKEVALGLEAKNSVAPGMALKAETALLEKLSAQTNALSDALDVLDKAIAGQNEKLDVLGQATYSHDTMIAAMNEVRAHGDALEAIVAKKYWPVPTYQDMLFY